MAKLKICHRCGSPRQLWRSHPPTCQECDRIINAKPIISKVKSGSPGLGKFYMGQSVKIPRNCMNCGRGLLVYNNTAAISVTAHILPKAEFPDIAQDDENIFFLGAVILGGCDCHDQWDRKGRAHRKTMTCYEYAVYQFHEHLKYKLSSHDYVKACDYLSLPYDDIN